MIKEFSKDFTINIIRRFGVSIVFLASIKLYTEKLGLIEFGNYSVLLFLLTLISSLSTTWLTAAYLRYSKEYNGYTFFNTIFNIQVISILFGLLFLILIIVYISITFIIKIEWFLFLCLILNFIGLSFFNFFASIFVSDRELKTLGYLTIFQALISFILSLILFKYDLHIKYIFFSNFISYLLVNVYSLNKIIKAEHSIKIEKKFFWSILQYSKPLLLLNLFSLILISGDQLLMKFFGLAEEIGIYSANYSITDKTLTLFTSIFTISYVPLLFSNWKENGKEETYSKYKKIIFLYIISILSLSILFLLLYDNFIPLLIDKKYVNKKIIIFILLGSLFFNLTNIISEVYTLNKRTDLLAFCFLPPTIFNIISNIIYIPKYGMYASAYISVFSYLFLFLLTLIIAKKTFFKIKT